MIVIEKIKRHLPGFQDTFLEDYVTTSNYKDRHSNEIELSQYKIKGKNSILQAMKENVEKAYFYPQILYQYKAVIMDEKERQNWVTLNAEDMNYIGVLIYNSEKQLKMDIKETWIYFWQILCYDFYHSNQMLIFWDEETPPQKYLYRWYCYTKDNLEVLDAVLFKLILKTYQLNREIWFDRISITWRDNINNIEADVEVYSIILRIVNTNQGINPTEKRRVFLNFLDSIINDIIMVPHQFYINSNIVLSILQSREIKSVTMNQLYGLYIGCMTSEDIKCTNAIEKGVSKIPDTVKKIGNIISNPIWIPKTYDAETIIYSDTVHRNWLAIKHKIDNYLNTDGKVPDFVSKNIYDNSPLIIGFEFEWYSNHKRYMDLKGLIMQHVNALYKSAENSSLDDQLYKEHSLHAWSYLFNPDVLQDLDSQYVLYMITDMNNILKPTTMIYNCVLDRLINKQNGEENYYLLGNLFAFGDQNDIAFNTITFNLWFKYFLYDNFEEKSPKKIVERIFSKLPVYDTSRDINIVTPKLFRNIVAVWIKYDLDLPDKLTEAVLQRIAPQNTADKA